MSPFKKIFCALLSFFTLALISSAEPVKVLMIGNSFSICNIRYLPSIAASLGKELDLVSMYIGGCPLERHANNIEKELANPEFSPYKIDISYSSIPKVEDTPAYRAKNLGDKQQGSGIIKMLKADKWNIVTIQQASPASWKYETYRPHADKLVETIRKYAPQAEIVIQQTWSYCNANRNIGTLVKPAWGINRDEMYKRLTECYRRLGKEFKFRIIPSGYAIELYRRRLPVKYAPVCNSADGKYCTEEMLFDDVVGAVRWKKAENRDGKVLGYYPTGDTIHLNRRGEFLQSCVWAASIFPDVDITALKYLPGDGEEEKQNTTPQQYALIRKCAADAVRDFPAGAEF